MGFGDRLKKMNTQWDETSSGFGELPEGVYSMQIVEVTLKETQSGNLRVSIQYAVADGEQSGATAYDGFLLEKDGQFFEIGAQMFKSWLERMGYEVPELDEIEDTLALITQEAPLVLAEVKKKGDFTNIRLKERMDGGAAPSTPSQKQVTRRKTPAASAPAAKFGEGDRVQFKDGNTVIVGEITSVTGKTCVVLSTDDEEWEDIPLTILEAASEEEEEEAEAEEEGGEDVTDLLAFCGAHDLEGVDDSMDRDAVIAAIDEYAWKADELTEDEVELLEGIGIAVEKPAPKKSAKKAKSKK